jgi:hypothetical protein
MKEGRREGGKGGGREEGRYLALKCNMGQTSLEVVSEEGQQPVVVEGHEVVHREHVDGIHEVHYGGHGSK